MIIRNVYKYLPVFIFFTNKFVHSDTVGKCWGIICTIRPQYKSDEALIQHELTHCKQWYRTFGIHGIWYHISDKYKLKCEVEAYQVQLDWYKNEDDEELHQQRLRIYARMIVDCYDLNITFLDAMSLLH